MCSDKAELSFFLKGRLLFGALLNVSQPDVNTVNTVVNTVNTVNTVKNSLEFADFIRGKTLDAEDELVSFDVVSFFTKIPVDLAIEIAKKRLREDVSLEKRTSLHVDFLIGLLSFCLNTTYFVYDGTYIINRFLVRRWVRLFLPSLLI